MMDKLKNTSKERMKPAPYIAFGSTEPISKEEIEKRKRIIERAEKLGINITRLDMESEYENPYKIEALIYINEEREVPEDLVRKIQEFEEKHIQEVEKENV